LKALPESNELRNLREKSTIQSSWWGMKGRDGSKADHPSAHVLVRDEDACASRFINLLHTVTSTVPMMISATHNPVHTPMGPQWSLNARKLPKGMPISQYPSRLVSMGVWVFPAPRRAPVATTCNPSNN